MSEKPTVFVVDGDAAARRLLSVLIASMDLDVKTFEDPHAFLESCRPARQGCIVLDVRLPGMSGLELYRELRERSVRLPVIFITDHGDVQIAVHAMKAGAVDFIEKPINNGQLLDSVQKAVAESVNAHRTLTLKHEIERRMASLTPRECQVLELVTIGETNKSIAKQLAISQRTVEIHRAKVMEKMHAGSLAELVRMVALLDFVKTAAADAALARPAPLRRTGAR